MKKILILVLFTIIILAKEYTGCGVTRKDAINNLSQNILVTVQTNMDVEKISSRSTVPLKPSLKIKAKL